ncbi:MAG: L-seryl-tRNA(Sec) selenium transferase [Candidatus Zixiibacteriota bacterium]|nr:MAG: L-seryl-tRNA(Sec) selenium transferase [candidate division Zixibacteria bacterium]
MAGKVIKQLRDFPSVEELLQSGKLVGAVSSVPRPVAADVVKEVVADVKSEFKRRGAAISLTEIHNKIRDRIRSYRRREISRVINATGIVVHTNLGRAPLSESIFDAVKTTVVGYGNIEYDLQSGSRGKRGPSCEAYLARLSGAENATVVNNCAAALLIILNTFANRKKVIISRGELVQIGGGFRIPDILKKSGARLCEVGTTNITNLSDYADAIDDKTALILRVHQSNFIQRGFTDQVKLKPLVALGRKHGVPVVNDLGSGVFVSTRKLLGYNEPTVQQSVRDGADLTCFSGDKMLGGCQAGLIVGSDEHIKKIRKNALFRTLRVDKIVFSMLEKMLAFYLNDDWMTNIKVWSILSLSESELYRRGKDLLKKLGNPRGISVEATGAYVGGGALPESSIPSVSIVFSPQFNATTLLKKFRDMPVPIIGRIDDDRLILDLKAVDETDLPYLTDAISSVLDEA